MPPDYLLTKLAGEEDINALQSAELIIAKKQLANLDEEKIQRADELSIANVELAFQNEEKEKRADELIIANKELAFQIEEKAKRADELIIANKELAFQNEEKEKRAAELMIANKELAFQNDEKEKRANELVLANKELIFQNNEKEKRADELVIANQELAFQNTEREKRAAELFIANKELAYQNTEKGKRADELAIANKELAFQNEEKEKRAIELAGANKELAFQNEEKEQFVYIVSHDLQEPLRTITNYAGLFNKRYSGKLDNEANRFLESITGAAGRMRTLIKDLLDYSVIQKDTAKAEIDCNLVLEEVMNDMSVSISESKTHISAENLPVVKGYLTGFRSLFQNLISNAIKYRKADTESVIRISAVSNEKEWLFSFSDNGIGIDKAFYDKLFIIFQRLHNKNEYSGTGIGLAQCKKIVDLHDGRIWVESVIDEGSTFHFTISKM